MGFRFSLLAVLLWCISLELVPSLEASENYAWFARCRGIEIAIELRIDEALVHRAILPICKLDEGSDPDRLHRTLDFSFIPRRAIVWEGYRDDHNTTPAGKPLNFQVWQADRDSRFLLLGFAVVSKHVLLTKDFHMVDPSRPVNTELTPGVRLTSYPLEHSRGAIPSGETPNTRRNARATGGIPGVEEGR
jgi:hypothetical protein